MTNNPAEHFQELLLNFSQAEDLDVRQRIEAELWEQYGMERAVFILDMSGFSLLTRKYGIVHYMSMVKRMQSTTEPIIDYGKILVVGSNDCFGDAVNRASKLGEDVASAGEILVTSEAMDKLPADAQIKAKPISLSI